MDGATAGYVNEASGAHMKHSEMLMEHPKTDVNQTYT